MTVAAALRTGAAALAGAPTDTPALEAAVLLADALGVSKERLFARMAEPVGARGMASFRRAIDLRRRAVPVAYIRGAKEFYGHAFSVDRRVLIPRPDTECLVEAALEVIDADPSVRRVHDVGTGSGCIAIALLAARPALAVSVSDRDAGCLEVCRVNQRRLLGGERMSAQTADLLTGVAGPFDLIVANPPYLAAADCARMAGRGWPEPIGALHGGRSGAELTLRLIAQAGGRLRPGGRLLLETAAEHVAALRTALAAAGFAEVTVRPDLAGRPRVMGARWPGARRPAGAGGAQEAADG